MGETLCFYYIVGRIADDTSASCGCRELEGVGPCGSQQVPSHGQGADSQPATCARSNGIAGAVIARRAAVRRAPGGDPTGVVAPSARRLRVPILDAENRQNALPKARNVSARNYTCLPIGTPCGCRPAPRGLNRAYDDDRRADCFEGTYRRLRARTDRTHSLCARSRRIHPRFQQTIYPSHNDPTRPATCRRRRGSHALW